MSDLHLKIIVIVIALVSIVAFAFYMSRHPPAKPYCEQFANTPARDLPAQCIRYWQ